MRKRWRAYILIVLLTILYPRFFWAQEFQWARGFYGKDDEYAKAIVSDNHGNSYAIGYFNDTIDFDPGPGVSNLVQTCQISGDMYIVKLDSLGRYVWAKRVGGTGLIFPRSIALDAKNSIYITGQFHQSIDFDPDPTSTNVITSMAGDCFILKLDSTGNYKWCKIMGNYGSSCMGNSIIHHNGEIIVAGDFGTYNGGPIDFDPEPPTVFTMSSSGSVNPFLVKFDTAGHFIWVKGFIGPGNSLAGGSVKALATNSLGDIYSTGYFRNSGLNNNLDFDPGPSTFTMAGSASIYYDVFTTKLDANGNFLWARSFVGNNTVDNVGVSICLDGQGNAYTMGYFQNTIDLDPTPSTTVTTASAGSSDVFISKLDLSGSFVWGKTFGGIGQEYSASMVCDTAKNLCFTGFVSTGCDFDPGPGTTSVTCIGQDGFISTLDQNGNLLWVKTFPSLTANAAVAGRALSIDKKQNYYLTGEYFDNVDLNPELGNTNFTAANTRPDFFVLKLGACNFPLDVSSSTTVCTGICTTLTANSAVSYSWTGGPNSSTYSVCPASTTIYSVSGTISSSCVRSGTIQVTVSSCTGIDENEAQNLSLLVYPNPVRDKLNIDVGLNAVKSIYITDVVGKVIREYPTSSNQIDLSNLANGVYFINLQTEYGRQISKIIKE